MRLHLLREEYKLTREAESAAQIFESVWSEMLNKRPFGKRAPKAGWVR